MDPMTMMAISAVAAPIVSGAVGSIMGSGDRKRAQKNIKKALAELNAVGAPPDLSREILMREFQSAGILTPELEEDIGLAETEFRAIQEDPELRQVQLEALNKFKQQSETGLGAEERAAFNQIQKGIRQDQRAKQEQILADAARRGQAGGGASLIAQLQSSQSGADQAAEQGNELAALIAQRVRQGTSDLSQASSGLRTQDYSVASDKARAIDERNRFLNQNATSRQMRNVGSKNEAQQYNLSNQQRLGEMNTNLANQEKLRQAEAERQFYLDKLGLAQAKAAARVGQAANYQAQADRTAEMAAGIGKGVGEGISAYSKQKYGKKEV